MYISSVWGAYSPSTIQLTFTAVVYEKTHRKETMKEYYWGFYIDLYAEEDLPGWYFPSKPLTEIKANRIMSILEATITVYADTKNKAIEKAELLTIGEC